MPTYEYRCPEGHDIEDFVLKMSDAKPEIPCPTCGKLASRRMSAGSGLLFKGSGFYITDYGKDGKKDQRTAAKASEGASTSADNAGSSKAGESKPAAATAPAAAGASATSSVPKSGPAK